MEHEHGVGWKNISLVAGFGGGAVCGIITQLSSSKLKIKIEHWLCLREMGIGGSNKILFNTIMYVVLVAQCDSNYY